MKQRSSLAAVLMLLAAALANTGLSSVSAAATKATVFAWITKSDSQYTCAVDGKQIAPSTGKLPYIDLDKALGERFEGRDAGQTLAIVLADKVSLEDAFLVRTIAHKVGYRTVRFFVVKSGAKAMSEIVVGSQFQLPVAGESSELVPMSQ